MQSIKLLILSKGKYRAIIKVVIQLMLLWRKPIPNLVTNSTCHQVLHIWSQQLAVLSQPPIWSGMGAPRILCCPPSPAKFLITLHGRAYCTVYVCIVVRFPMHILPDCIMSAPSCSIPRCCLSPTSLHSVTCLHASWIYHSKVLQGSHIFIRPGVS